jgi:sialic acid synthase SpsE
MRNFNFIAELCQNHLGNIKNVEKMLDECAINGAKLVKLQYIYSKNLSFRPRFENGLINNSKIYSIKRPFKSEFKRLKKLELPEKSFEKFVRLCEKYNVSPLVTCFSRDHVNKIYNLGFKSVKVASYDCSSFQLLRELSKKFNELIISTGATFDDEIEKSVKILKENKTKFTLLHCITLYPTPLNFLNLARIKFLKKFTDKVGYSDHSLSTNKRKNLASLCSIYFGAKYIERHIRIFDHDKSKDGKVSILPGEIKEIIEFSKLSKNSQKKYLKDKFKIDPRNFYGKEKRKLTHEELLNRDYYRGRFCAKSSVRDIYNWEEVKI